MTEDVEIRPTAWGSEGFRPMISRQEIPGSLAKLGLESEVPVLLFFTFSRFPSTSGSSNSVGYWRHANLVLAAIGAYLHVPTGSVQPWGPGWNDRFITELNQ